jgi:MFS family permease
MGLLVAAQRLPGVFVALPAGIVADWKTRRPVLVTCDTLRMLLVGSIPVAAALGRLTFAQLVLIALATGCLTVLFDTTYQAFIPTVVERDALIRGNAGLAAGQSLAEVGGPGIAGVVSGVASPPGALAVDAVSFGISALSIFRIRLPARASDRDAAAPAERPKAMAAMRQGLRLLLSNEILRVVALSGGAVSFFANVQEAVLVLFAYRELHISPVTLGVIYTVSGLFGLGGALLVERVSRVGGVGPTIIGAQMVKALGATAFAVAGGPAPVVIALFLAGEGMFALGIALFNVNSLSVRHAIVHENVLGRVTASSRLFTLAALPLGALAGGGLADLIGVRATLAVGAVGIGAAGLYLLGSAVRRLRELPSGEPAVA